MNSFCIATWNLDYLSPNGERAKICQAKLVETKADVWILTETRKEFQPGEDYRLIEVAKGGQFKDDFFRRAQADCDDSVALFLLLWSIQGRAQPIRAVPAQAIPVGPDQVSGCPFTG